MRAKILAQITDEKAVAALKKLETAKTPAEILDLAYDAAELGAQMMIKFDKKRAASVALSHLGTVKCELDWERVTSTIISQVSATKLPWPKKATQTEALETFTELPRTLHMGVTIVFGRVTGTPIHYPGKMSETLILGSLFCKKVKILINF